MAATPIGDDFQRHQRTFHSVMRVMKASAGAIAVVLLAMWLGLVAGQGFFGFMLGLIGLVTVAVMTFFNKPPFN